MSDCSRSGSHSLAWSIDLEAQVDAFCKANTKAAKVDWLKDHGVPQEQAIAQGTTLDDGNGSYQYQFGRSVKLGGLTAQSTAKAEDARRLQQDMERLATQLEKPNATAQERRLLGALPFNFLSIVRPPACRSSWLRRLVALAWYPQMTCPSYRRSAFGS